MDVIDIRNLTKKWFSDETPKNYKDASTTIGSGDNGIVTVIALNDISTTKKIKAVVATDVSAKLNVAYTSNIITITLGTDATGAADDTKNTATLIAKAIDELDGFSAIASGTGATPIQAAINEKAFTAGQLGTPCMVSGVALESNGTYYVCVAPDTTTKNSNWRTFTLASY